MRPTNQSIEPFALERYFARWEFSAPYLLCSSDIQGMPMGTLVSWMDEETRALWESLTLGYTETKGDPLLRNEIARLYTTARPDDVLCFAGAEEAIYIFQRVLLRHGDHVIVTFPGYQSLYQVAETIGAKVSRWMLRPESDSDGKIRWRLDLADLRNLVQPETRLIVVNFPHNPTGVLPSQEEWLEIQDIAQEAGCYLFSDEVYRLMEYNPQDRLPAGVDVYDRGISLGVMSKPFGLAGLRIGWLALRDQDLLSQLASYKDYTTICNSAPAEILALAALRSQDRLLKRSLDMIRNNLALVEEAMEDLRAFFEWIPPQAGSIAFPRWRGELPVEAFTDALVQQEGVLLLPGTVYDYPGGHFRLGLGRDYIPEALERLRRFCSHRSRIGAV